MILIRPAWANNSEGGINIAACSIAAAAASGFYLLSFYATKPNAITGVQNSIKSVVSMKGQVVPVPQTTSVKTNVPVYPGGGAYAMPIIIK